MTTNESGKWGIFICVNDTAHNSTKCLNTIVAKFAKFSASLMFAFLIGNWWNARDESILSNFGHLKNDLRCQYI